MSNKKLHPQGDGVLSVVSGKTSNNQPQGDGVLDQIIQLPKKFKVATVLIVSGVGAPFPLIQLPKKFKADEVIGAWKNLAEVSINSTSEEV